MHFRRDAHAECAAIALHGQRNRSQFMETYALLMGEFPATSARTLRVRVETLHLAARIESEQKVDYFDAAIASECLQQDGVIVSTDRVFDKIPNLKRVW